MGPAARPFAIFCFFSLALLGLVPALAAAFGLSMDFSALAAEASRETGVPWTSNLWDVLRLCRAEPGLALLVLGSAVPSLAALATLLVLRDAAGWRDLVARLSPRGPEPFAGGIGARVLGYALISLALVIVLVSVYALRDALSPGTYARPALSGASAWLTAIVFAALLDQGAVLEEAGWRGHATPGLERNGVSPLAAAVAVGVAWGLWHVPRDVVAGVIERLGWASYLFAFLPSFVLGTVVTSVVASYAMHRLGGSLWPAIVVHGLANDAMGLGGAATVERALTPFHQITKALPFALLALAVVIATRGQLGAPRAPVPKG